jgi:hypothetical protein
MKLLKKSFSGALVAISFLFASSFSANSAVIKHDILDGFGDKIGEIAVELDNSALNTGIVDSFFDTTLSLVNISLGELYPWAAELIVLDFEAVVDSDNIAAGIEFFAVDTNDLDPPPVQWSYQLIYDAFDLNSSFIDVFTFDGNVVLFDFISLGQAEVTGLPPTNQVSAPATLGIFALAMAALYGRRKLIS